MNKAAPASSASVSHKNFSHKTAHKAQKRELNLKSFFLCFMCLFVANFFMTMCFFVASCCATIRGGGGSRSAVFVTELR